MASKINGIIEQINVNGTNNAIASTAYGYCETAAATAAKTVEMTDFKLIDGVTVAINFANASTSTTVPTLNINNTGAKSIYMNGVAVLNGWNAGATLILTYDETSDIWNTNANSLQGLTKKSLTTTTINTNNTTDIIQSSSAGKFFGRTTNIDWVGLQISSSVDRFQLVAQLVADANTLIFRQNDNSSVSASNWSAWQQFVHTAFNGGAGGAGAGGSTTAGSESVATPVYIAANGTATPIAYTIGADVPIGAVFTDHYDWGDITGKPTKITLTGAVTGSVTLGNGENSIATTVNHNHDDRYKIASGVITLGSNTITPITSIAELTGSTITAANLRTNLGLSAALRFIGKATTDMSESTTTAPTVTGVTNYVPEVGDVVLDKNNDAEYVCIAKSGSTYTWELLGRSGSWATSTHTHGDITNDGKLTNANRIVWTDANKKVYAGYHYANSTKIAVNSSSEPTENLYVSGSIQFNLGTSNTSSNNRKFIVQGESSNKMSIAPTGIQVYNSSNAVETLYFQAYGGNMIFGSSSYATATRDMYGVFDFKSSNGFTYSGIGTGSDNTARPIWFSYNGITGRPVYDNDFKYNPSTNTITIGTGTLSATAYSGTAANVTGTVAVAHGGTGVTTVDDIFATYGVEYIVGTQTGTKATNWTGQTKSTELYVGKTIAYQLPIAGDGSATLELTFPDGTTTGQKAVYAGNTRLTTHYPANSIMIMVWNGTNWRTNPYYNTNTNTLMRTYALSPDVEFPILAGSQTTAGAWTTDYTSSYKDLYGIITSTTANRATINPSTGHITAPAGITANITGNISGTASNVTGTVAIEHGGTGKTTAAEAWTALGGGDSGKHADSYFALASHNHAAGDINSGTFDLARIPTITNAKLTNSSLTVGNKSISLGSSGTVHDILKTSTNIGTDTSWDQYDPGIYYVASNAAFTGTNSPENANTNNGISPYRYGQLIVSRAGTGGVAQFYISHNDSNSASYGIHYRTGWNSTYVDKWSVLLDSHNYTNYTVKKDGTGASGTWGISINGTAAKATADADNNTISSTYLKRSGGEMTGPLTWKDSTALPEASSLSYVLGIDAFASGGTTKWTSIANLRSSLGLLNNTGSESSPIYINANGVLTECTWNLLRRKKIGTESDHQRSVIALCKLSANNTGINSHWHGRIYRVRDNGLVNNHYADVDFTARYAGANTFFYSFRTDKENTGTEALTGSGYRACTFIYNGQQYGGLEFYQGNASTFYVDGTGTFAPFSIAYYSTNNSGTVLNQEINDSLGFSTDQCQRQSDYIYGVLRGNASSASAANLTTTANAIAYYTNTTGTFGSKASANGVLYATSANGTLNWGILPIAQGGTGATTANDAANTLISSLPTWTAAPTADTYFIRRDTGGTAAFGQVKFSSIANITNGKITLGPYSITPVTSVNGHTGSSVSVTAGDLGLSSALRYQGTTTTAMEDGLTTAEVTINGNSFTPAAGDVVIYDDAEYLWTGSLWEFIGAESSFKKVQTAVSTSTASGNSATTFISSVTQDTQGVITVKTSTLDTSGAWAGSAGTLANKTLTVSNLNQTAGSYAFSISSTTALSQISISNADYVGLQIGDNADKWQLTAISNSLFFRQNDSGGTNTSWNDWVKILSSSNYTDYAVAKTAGVTAVTWNNTDKKITRTINSTTADVVTFSAGTDISLSADTTTLTITAANQRVEILDLTGVT